MEGGRFTAIILIVVVLVGGTFYYAFSNIQNLRTQVADLQARSTGWSTSLAQVAARADAAKTAADDANATLAKLGPIDQFAKQVQDAAAAAAKPAAKPAEPEAPPSKKGHRR